ARRFPVVPPHAGSIVVHAISAIVIALVHETYWIALLVSLRPFDRMNIDMSKLRQNWLDRYLECLPVELAMYCLVLGFSLALDYYGRYRERALQAAELEASLA